VKFLIDRCVGHRLAVWLHEQGHDVLESKDLGPDPGDRELLRWSQERDCVLVTMDKDFGELLFVEEIPHCGLVRLPDVRSKERISLMEKVLAHHEEDLARHSIITVRGGRIRVSRTP
jgi:predicted nuclease of predicted toxin-antitoxin system